MSNLNSQHSDGLQGNNFNDAALLPDSTDHKSGYPLIDDPYYQDIAAYMIQIKKYANVMSNLIGVYQWTARQFKLISLPLG